MADQTRHETTVAVLRLTTSTARPATRLKVLNRSVKLKDASNPGIGRPRNEVAARREGNSNKGKKRNDTFRCTRNEPQDCNRSNLGEEARPILSANKYVQERWKLEWRD